VNRELQIAAVLALAILAAELPGSAQGPVAARPAKAPHQAADLQGRIYRDGNSWVQEVTGSLPLSKVLRVRTQIGSVQVEGGSQSNITYTFKKRVYLNSEAEARRILQWFRVAASTHGSTALLEGLWEGSFPAKFAAEVLLQVPQNLAQTRLSTEGGNISVRNIAGRVEVASGGGNLQLAGISGPVVAETGGGNISVSNVPQDLSVRSGGGSINIAGASGRVTAESAGGNIALESSTGAALLQTGAGSIQIGSCGGELRASSGGGNIEVHRVSGPALLETLGGSIRVGEAHSSVNASTGAGTIELYKLSRGARVETGAGSILAEFVGSSNIESELETSIGDIVVFLVPQSRMNVQGSIQMANGHRIRSEFSELKVYSEGSEWGPQNLYTEGMLNGGGPMLKVSTISGNIELRRAAH
jgi:DUF4097 and DUF4098 domain-containing protein YvlB